jgi:hypothetical protein
MELIVRVKKSELLSKIKDNKFRFEKTYKELLIVFEAATKTYRLEYDKYVKKTLEGKKSKEPKSPVKPEDHLKEYEDYITMFEASTDDIIPLDEGRFRFLWLDLWNWRYGFSQSVQSYYSLAASTIGLENSCAVLSDSAQYYKTDGDFK